MIQGHLKMVKLKMFMLCKLLMFSKEDEQILNIDSKNYHFLKGNNEN